ncbi:MAG: M1 family metallopeptidase, partial [Bacteroidia bacterium]|nr:M1 family metallopeptidase [Bacteroidia bacterium]
MKPSPTYNFLRLRFVLLFAYVLSSYASLLQAQPLDVLYYKVYLKPNFSDSSIQGICTIQFRYLQPKQAPIQFDLEGLKATKVVMGNKKQVFKQSKKFIQITLSPKLSYGDTGEVTIYYYGKPLAPSPFGGFYFKENEAYNLGVSLEQIPHNFGRVWFPCIDNFTDKALYEFLLEAPPGITGIANGTLQLQKKLPNGNTIFHWTLSNPIPTYLASVAFGNYICINDTLQGIQKKIPVSLYVKPEAKLKAQASFQNLEIALKYFEELFGPYPWEKIGYVSVAMEGGAMEHATNIAYPHHCIDGTNKCERLWVHELSHSWFGNLVTCASAEDMWLNEGFARYCEALFFEKTQGKNFFLNYIQKIHEKVITQTHIIDNGYFALSPIPLDITYGSTVYDKGALVAHTLRNYLGDSLFFGGLRLYFDRYKFRSASTKEFEQVLSEYCQCNLFEFFREWVYTPGFYSIHIDSLSTLKHKNIYEVKLWVSQESIHNAEILDNLPLKVRFWAATGEYVDKTFDINEARKPLIFYLPFLPLYVMLDPEQEVCDYTLSQIIIPERNQKYKLDPLGISFT